MRCQLPPRWCICRAMHPVACPLKVEILTHHREETRPSSTGHLIQRVVPSAAGHLYRPERPLNRGEILQLGKTFWILHPLGEPLTVSSLEPAENLQIMLIDGSWRQSGAMARAVEGWGRKVSLPMSGASRYWLRAQQGDGQFSTIEALLFLLAALGQSETHAALRLQFELHVYANLCARGRKAEAADYLRDSPVRGALVEMAERFSSGRLSAG